MTMDYFDDETLMAFADGELDEATALRVEAALEHDEALAERLAVFLDTRLAVASAMRPLIDEPVPDALAASIRRMAEEAEAGTTGTGDGNVIAFRSRDEPPRRVTRQQWLMPIAASILAVITGVGGFMAGRSSQEGGTGFDNALAAALNEQPSGGDMTLGGSRTLRIVASFMDGRGELCREYELTRPDETTATVACRTDNAWVTRLALSSPRTEGYVPASAQDTIDAYLASIDAGGPLSAEDEKSALQKAP
jgi:hypothetical protein